MISSIGCRSSLDVDTSGYTYNLKFISFMSGVVEAAAILRRLDPWVTYRSIRCSF